MTPLPTGSGSGTCIDPPASDGGQLVMNRWPGLVPETFPIEVRQRAVAACERFESAWRSGERPAIEPYLEGLGPVDRVAALHGLVALEFKLRCEQDDPPTLKEYVSRFPGDATVVATAVATSKNTPASATPANGRPRRRQSREPSRS